MSSALHPHPCNIDYIVCMKHFKILLTSLVILLLTALISANHAQEITEPLVYGGLSISEAAPPVNGTSLRGKSISWVEKLEQGPVVVIFFRGTWCPYCSRYLNQIDNKLKEENLNASVIALAPQYPEFSREDVKDEEYTFDVIYDEGLFYMKAYKAVSKTSSMQDYAKKKPEWLKQHESTTLPVPATFIINQQGIITARHFDEDYKERMEIDQLVSELKKLADR